MSQNQNVKPTPLRHGQGHDQGQSQGHNQGHGQAATRPHNDGANGKPYPVSAKNYPEHDPIPIDALLIVSFGGPEGQDDVIPFLENVTRGRNIPRERLEEVATHYRHFGGVSPINEQCRQLKLAIEKELALRADEKGEAALPVYWGNRNWAPYINDEVAQITEDGHKHMLCLMTSAFSSYSGCRQYRENVEAAQRLTGENAPYYSKLRMFYNHASFIEVMQDKTEAALANWSEVDRDKVRILFCAHSIPSAMAYNCRYEAQLHEAARLVMDQFKTNSWEVVYQSRSGPPQMPWLEPDVCDRIEELNQAGVKDVVLVPIGFVSDHMEVMYDLDEEAKELCEKLGVNMKRAGTVGTEQAFIKGLVDLIEERCKNTLEPASIKRQALGCHGASHDVCPPNCCLSGATGRPAGRSGGAPTARPHE